MEKGKAIDKIDEKVLEIELVRNERAITHPKLGKIKLFRATPRVEGLIAEERRKIWHRDLKDPSILTRKEVEKLLADRGVWSEAEDDLIADLTQESGRIMNQLSAMGFTSILQLQKDLESANDALLRKFADVPEATDAVFGLMSLEDKAVAKNIGILRKLAPDSDVDELLENVELYRRQADLIQIMNELRANLNEMLQTQSSWFSSTLETRAETVERMAKMFYCTSNIDTGKPLWKNIEAMWDEDGQVLSWLQTQYFYFENGITPEFAEVLEEHGFTQRGVSIESESENSQDPPKSSLDGESPESASKDSSEQLVPTT